MLTMLSQAINSATIHPTEYSHTVNSHIWRQFSAIVSEDAPTIIMIMIIINSWRYWECHDDVIKWKHFPRYWPFVRGIPQSPVNSPHKGQWRGALMFSLMCVWINDWVNNRDGGDLRCYRTDYDVIVMFTGNLVLPEYSGFSTLISMYQVAKLRPEPNVVPDNPDKIIGPSLSKCRQRG